MQGVPKAWSGDEPAQALVAWLRRFGLHPGGSWSLSWVLIFSGGVVLADLPPSLATHAGMSIAGALFAGLTVVGALAFAGRPAPLWILPGALALGLLRAATRAVVGPEAAHVVGLLYEPSAMLVAAAILFRAELLRDQPVTRSGLVLAMLGLAGVEASDAIAGARGVRDAGFTPAWLVVGPAAALLELAAMWLWIAARELRIERAERAQRLLEDKEAWLFDFFEKAPDMLLVLQPGTCEILRCNRRFSETLGYARRDVVGRALLDFLDPATLRKTRPALLGPEWRRLRNFELRLLRPDGSPLEVLANFALRLDPAGGPPELRAVLHDVTKLRRDPAEPAAEADLPRVAAEHAAAGIFHADPEGRCGFVNPSFCEISGLSPEQAREQGFFACVHAPDRGAVQAAWREAARRRTTLRARHRVQVRGRESLVITECVPLVAGDGSLRGFVGSVTRLTGPDASFSPDSLRGGGAAAGEHQLHPIV